MSAPSDRPAPSGGLIRWFGLLGGHVAWSIQLMLAFALVDAACPRGSAWYLTAVWLVTAAAAGVAGLAAWSAWVTYRRVGDGVGGTAARDGFMGLVGLFLNGIYVYAIVLSAAFIATLRFCG